MSESRVTIYTVKSCGYCTAARRLLVRDDIAFDEIDLSGDRERRTEIAAKFDWPTVPVVLIDGELVGGYRELARKRAEGGLKELRRTSAG